MVYEAILRIQAPQPIQGSIVFFVASIGLVANVVGMKLLHSHREQNINVKAAYLHLLSDLLGSLGAILAGAVVWATGWLLIDPIMTFFFAILMLISSWRLVIDSVKVLMESVPPHLDAQQIKQDLSQLQNVQGVHDLHIWSVSAKKFALSVHLVATHSESVLHHAHVLLKDHYQIVHTTIQVEHPDHFQSERCYDCAPQ
jgi:cobalt-zinc-cadmium efflux system protein